MPIGKATISADVTVEIPLCVADPDPSADGSRQRSRTDSRGGHAFLDLGRHSIENKSLNRSHCSSCRFRSGRPAVSLRITDRHGEDRPQQPCRLAVDYFFV